MSKLGAKQSELDWESNELNHGRVGGNDWGTSSSDSGLMLTRNELSNHPGFVEAFSTSFEAFTGDRRDANGRWMLYAPSQAYPRSTGIGPNRVCTSLTWLARAAGTWLDQALDKKSCCHESSRYALHYIALHYRRSRSSVVMIFR